MSRKEGEDHHGPMEEEHPDWDEEQLLIAAVKAGQGEAWNLLVLRYQDQLRRYLERGAGARLSRFITVEDLMQQVYARGMAAVSKLKEGARPDEFKALLLQHASWVLLNAGRGSSNFRGDSVMARGQPDGGEPSEDHEPISPEPESMGPVTLRDHNLWLRRLVSRLDHKYSSVLELYLDGRSFPEIASQLSITESSARKRFLRAARQAKEMTREEQA
jgi:RNA polymerase sigma factor (sigma-70 family)